MARWPGSPRRPGRPTSRPLAGARRRAEGSRCGGLLARGAPARRRVRRAGGPGCGDAGCVGAPTSPTPSRRSTAPASSCFLAYPHSMPVRRPRRQPAVAARESRSRHQDHLALVGGDAAPRPRKTLDVRERRDPPAHVAARDGRGPGLHLSRASPGRRRHAARPRPHRVRGLRQGPGVNALDLLGAPVGDVLPYLSDSGHGRKDRRLPEARQDRGQPAPARARHRRGDAARGGEGPDAQGSRTSKRATPSTRSTPSARSRRSRAGARQQFQMTPPRRLRRRPSAVGHGDRPVALHRLLGLRHRLLRREQHPDGGRGPRSSAAAR